MAYVNILDVKDLVVKRVIDSGIPEIESYYIPKADKAILSLAQRKGIYSASDISFDDSGYLTNFELQEYWKSYFKMMICSDRTGANNVSNPDNEIYMIKQNTFQKEVNSRAAAITREMIIDEIDELGDTVTNTYVMTRS